MKYLYQTPQTNVMNLTLQGEVLQAVLGNTVAGTESQDVPLETAPARKLYIK